MSLPRVSIGMPVYNAARYLKYAVNSFLSQSFTDFEIVLSDNASTDRTAEIAQALAKSDERIRYIRQDKNIGAAANFAFVLQEARGDLFQWAAHDDLWRPFWLERAVAALDADKELGFSFPSFSIKDQVFGFLDEYDPAIFSFIAAQDSRERLIGFFALHFSHKCNIVYSLGRADLFREAVEIQGLENDGVLAAVLLGHARGEVILGSPFLKRWGVLRSRLRTVMPVSTRRKENLRKDVARSLPILVAAFPTVAQDLYEIMEATEPGHYPKGYQVVDVELMLSRHKAEP